MDPAQITSRSSRWTIGICALLLLAFSILSYSAVLTKNATIDEPAHAMSGWLAIKHGDFRLESVNPSLWKCWAALGNIGANLKMIPDPVIWKDQTWDPIEEVAWSSHMLYDNPGVNGDAFINRSRAMMLVLGVLLGALIARWSYRLTGPVAAIVATGMFCFDPNFIAHSPLVKSDVAFALALLALVYTVWRLGQKATARLMVAVGFICGVVMNIKFSGVIAGPILAAMLLGRAMIPQPWDFLSMILRSRFQRASAAFVTCLFAAFCCYAVTWASYGFRYRPAPSPTVRMDMPAIYARARFVETTAELMRAPTAPEIAAHAPSLVMQFVQWADRLHLLPQPMLGGLLYQHTCVQMWPAFLNGELYGQGRISYFPLAILYKTPVSELLAYVAMAIVVLVVAFSRWRRTSGIYRTFLWAALCLLIPFTLFGAAALTTHLNFGIRNILPLFPFMQITTGCAAAFCWRHRPRLTMIALWLLGIGLATESLSAWPDYIAYFNFSTGGEIGGIAHLGDSNLDWGQDIKSLSRWQRQHSELPLFAKLYESVDPRFYGLEFHPLSIISEGPSVGEPVSDIPMTHGWIAVSATHLQGLYIKPWEMPFYARLRNTRPTAILGGTIYIYEYKPPG